MITRSDIRSFLRRNSQTIPLTIIGICIGGIFLMQAVTISTMSKQLEAQTHAIEKIKEVAKQIDANAEARSKQVQAIDRHLDCIVEFFSQTDRSVKAIEDIDRCEIRKTSELNIPQKNNAVTQSRPPAPTQPIIIKPVTPKAPSSPQRTSEPRTSEQPAPTKPAPSQPENNGLLDRVLEPIKNLLGR